MKPWNNTQNLDIKVFVALKREDSKLRKQGIEMESISLENIYELLRTFEEIYDIMDDKEQKNANYLFD